jgi:cell division protein FtsB
VELRMNHSSEDEFEEVESPFAARTDSKAAQRERLRTRKNSFSRPFAAEASQAPAVFETTSTRRSVGSVDNSELIKHRSSELAETDIDYLEEEDDEVEVVKKPRATAKKKEKTNLLPKIAWSVIGLLILRLICMDRGVWDYFATEGDIRVKQNELRSIQRENKELSTEIAKIQVDKNYQRSLAKEHLGVIAADEFLILFAGETPEATEEKSASF